MAQPVTFKQQYYKLPEEISRERQNLKISLLLSKSLVLAETLNNELFTGCTAVNVTDII